MAGRSSEEAIRILNQPGVTCLVAVDTPNGLVAIEPARVSEVMYNISRSNMRHDSLLSDRRYAQGALVGFFSALVAIGWTPDDALALCKRYAPKDYDRNCIPESWLEKWDACNEQPGG